MNSTTDQEIYRHVSEFTVWIQQKFPGAGYHISNNIEELLQLSTQYHGICEERCTYGESEDLDRQAERIEQRIREIFDNSAFYQGLEIHFRGDPRGWPIKLVAEEGTRGIPVIH